MMLSRALYFPHPQPDTQDGICRNPGPPSGFSIAKMGTDQDFPVTTRPHSVKRFFHTGDRLAFAQNSPVIDEFDIVDLAGFKPFAAGGN